MSFLFIPNFMRLLGLMTLLCSATVDAQTLMQEPLMVSTPEGVLHASVMRPKSSEPLPVALLIAGSGPTDRNGNNSYGARNDSLKRLAQRLSKMGIASVRFDKRGVGQSTELAPQEQTLRAEDYVSDIERLVHTLKEDERFSEVILIGHSEGALFASLAAQKVSVEALILIAGTGRPVADTLRLQLAQQPLPTPLVNEAYAILTQLENKELVEHISEPLQPLFRPSVQPYLISLFQYDPIAALSNSTVPGLIIQGDQDIQVHVDDALLLAQARPDLRLVVIQGMNHVLRIVHSATSQLASYNEPRLPLAAQLGVSIEDFLTDQGILPPSSN